MGGLKTRVNADKSQGLAAHRGFWSWIAPLEASNTQVERLSSLLPIQKNVDVAIVGYADIHPMR